MSNPEFNLPEPLQEKIVTIGASVTLKDVDSYGRLQEIVDKSAKLQRILDAWERQHREERSMRQTYATCLLVALFVQAFLVNAAFFLIGLGYLKVSEWVANSFILAVFAEVASMTFFIIKYLFPKTSADVLATLEKL